MNCDKWDKCTKIIFANGPRGPRGFPGPAGSDGATGSTGPAGTQQGPTGLSGALATNPYDLFVKAGSVGGDGGRQNPYGTIAEGYAAVMPYGTINILEGIYPLTTQLQIAKDGVTLEGKNGAKIVLQAAVIPFLITAKDVTIKNLQITSDLPYPNEFIQIGGSNAVIKDNEIFGPPQAGDSSGWVVNRGVVAQNGAPYDPTAKLSQYNSAANISDQR